MSKQEWVVRPAVVSRIGVCRTTADRSGREMFAGLLTSRLVFLDAVGSDPTKPRKIPGALLVRWRLCPLQPAAASGRGEGGEVGERCGARQRAALRSALGRAGLMRNSSCASTRPTGDLLTMLTVCLCSLPPDPTHRLGPGTEPYSMHTGFNPSKSGYIQQVCPGARSRVCGCGSLLSSSNCMLKFHGPLC